MSLNIAINLSEEYTQGLIDFFSGGGCLEPIIIELKDEDSILTFTILKNIYNNLNVRVDIFNKKYFSNKSIDLGTIIKYNHLFKVYNFTIFKNNYFISVRPFHIKNKTLYYSYMHGLSYSFKSDVVTYIKNINLNITGCNNDEQIWNIIYPILSDFNYYKNEKDVLSLVRDKLSYYGYNDEIPLEEYELMDKTELANNNNFKKVISGLLIFLINNILDENNIIDDEIIKKITLISEELTNFYYEFIY